MVMVLAAYNRKKMVFRYPVNLIPFLAKIKNGRHIQKEETFLKLAEILCRSKILPKLLYLAQVRRYRQF